MQVFLHKWVILVDDQGAFAALKENLWFSEPFHGFSSLSNQAKKTYARYVFFVGGRSGTRTLGPLIKSQLLYQLS